MLFVLLTICIASPTSYNNDEFSKSSFRRHAESFKYDIMSETAAKQRIPSALLTKRSSKIAMVPEENEGIDENMRQASTTDASTVKPKGYLWDPCSQDTDCFGTRLCVRADEKGFCKGSTPCLCLLPVNDKEKIIWDLPNVAAAFKYQLCHKCKECEAYPEESCQISFDDPEGAEGVCASTYVVYEGILRETDCNTYPNAIRADL